MQSSLGVSNSAENINFVNRSVKLVQRQPRIDCGFFQRSPGNAGARVAVAGDRVTGWAVSLIASLNLHPGL